MAVKMWGTPTARDHEDGATTLENTPENGLLARQVINWSTPRSSDGEKGGPNQSFGAGGVPLVAQAVQWPTATVMDSVGARDRTSGRSNPDSRHSDGVTLCDAIRLYSLPPHPATLHGSPSSPSAPNSRRHLNPLFVEWLMGWPPGWTDFGCSEMALSLFKQRMRSELLSLASPSAAPPQQLSLLA